MSLLTNYKYQAHLRNHGADFDLAKRRIKQINLQQHELHVRAKRYRRLFEANGRDLAWMGINEKMVQCYRNQYKQRHNTLKKALAEVEDQYNIKVTQEQQFANGELERIARERAVQTLQPIRDPDNEDEDCLGAEHQRHLARKTLQRYDSIKKGEERRVLYNPDQSSDEEALSAQLEQIYTRTKKSKNREAQSKYASPGYNFDELLGNQLRTTGEVDDGVQLRQHQEGELCAVRPFLP